MKTVLLRAVLLLIPLGFFAESHSQAGTLDSSFGVNGRATPTTYYTSNLLLQKDAKILAVGTEAITWDYSNLVLSRFLSSGIPDSTFGDDGKAVVHFDNPGDVSFVASGGGVIQSDGKIVIGGYLRTDRVQPFFFALARILPNGKLDSSFGINGKKTDAIAYPTENGLYALSLQADDKILAAGYADAYCLVRYTASGFIDSSFASSGVLRNQDTVSSGVYDLFIQPDNKIVTAASRWFYYNAHDPDFMINRVLPNGKYDSSFGSNGFVYTDFGNSNDQITSIGAFSDGKMIAVGNTSDGTHSKIAVAKYKTNGALDLTFGVNGKVVSDFGESSASANKVLIQQDNKILIAGSVLVRLNANGTIDSTFGTNGKSPNFNYTATQGVLQMDQKIVLIASDFLRFKNDTPVSVSVTKNISVAEGNTGTTPVQFKVVLNKASTSDVFVNYNTTDITATAGSDYIATSGTLRIKAGKTKGTISVNIIGDNTREKTEGFALVLSNPVNAVLGTVDSATCAIKNDDPSFAKATDVSGITYNPLHIYPNPVHDVLRVGGLKGNSKTTITIIDAEGKVIAFSTIASGVFTQNIKQLTAGTYFVKIESAGKTETLKFIKQ